MLGVFVNHPLFWLIYLFCCFLASLYIYHKIKKFYDHDSEINKKYPEFRRYDNLSFTRLFIGIVIFVIPKALIFILTLGSLSLVISIGDIRKYHPIKEFVFRKFMWMILLIFGNVRPNEIKKDPKLIEKIYKKYLGDDYIIDYNANYATLIGNHSSYIDSFYYTYKYGTSFISKKTILKVPFVSQMAKYNHSLFLDRTNKEEREKTVDEIIQRQKDIMQGKYQRKLNIFPEGTITSGRYLIKFKRGAFVSLLPVKPLIQLLRKNEQFESASGALALIYHIIVSANYHYTPVDFLELPVIAPTEFMYNNYKCFGNEKWEIFMNVCRHIMSECSGLELKESGYSDKLDYLSLIKGKKVKNT